MKKILLGLSIGMFMLFSFAVLNISAQTISIPTGNVATMTSSQKQALIQSLTKILAQLTAQLQVLLAQRQNNSGTSTSTVNTLTQSFVLSRDLTVGSKGEDVTVLQKFLISRGFLLKISDGYFDNETKVALAKYQVSKEIYPALGYFGPKTRNVINPINISSIPTSTTVTPTKSSQSSSSSGGSSGGGSYSSGSSGGGQSSSSPVSPISQPTSTTTNATSTLVDPTASLTVNGSHSVIVYPGDSVSYVWSGSGADTFTSSFTSDSSNCSSGENWVANSA